MDAFTSLVCFTCVMCCLAVAESQYCPDGWVKHDEYCYDINTKDPKTWSEANMACRKMMGRLLRIDTTDKLVFIKTKLATKGDSGGFWTDLNDLNPSSTNTTRVWQWGTGSPISGDIVFKHWNVEPDNIEEDNCVAISLDTTLSTERCSDNKGYICQLSSSNGCSVGWLLGDNVCYFVSNNTDPSQRVTWQRARSICQGMENVWLGTPDLLSLNSEEDLNYFQSSMKYWTSYGTNTWWTGLNDRYREGKFTWANGQAYNSNFVKWAHEPDNVAGMEHCGVLLKEGTFSDKNCEDKKNYICEKTIYRPVTGQYYRDYTDSLCCPFCATFDHRTTRSALTAQGWSMTTFGGTMFIACLVQ